MQNITEKDRAAMSKGDCFYFDDPEGILCIVFYILLVLMYFLIL